jgi:hypothetical protein
LPSFGATSKPPDECRLECATVLHARDLEVILIARVSIRNAVIGDSCVVISGERAREVEGAEVSLAPLPVATSPNFDS